MTSTPLSTRRSDPVFGVVVTRSRVPDGLDVTALPKRLREALTVYADRLDQAETLRARGAELDAAVRAARAADQEALTEAVRRGDEPTLPPVTKEDRARMIAEGHRRKVNAVEAVLDEDERNLVRVAAASLPEVEAIADSATEQVSEPVAAALAELRDALVERQQRRAAFTWARAVAGGRSGKVLDGNAVVSETLRGVEDLLRQ